MTEQYWQRFMKEYWADPMNTNALWVGVKKDMDKMHPMRKHPLELYSMCKSDNPYIRQIKSSPNITLDMVAELICRDVACDLQYCLSLHEKEQSNRRSKLKLHRCENQREGLNSCLLKEKNRIRDKELKLRKLVEGVEGREQVKDIIAMGEKAGDGKGKIVIEQKL
jgi:hypothetical protein